MDRTMIPVKRTLLLDDSRSSVYKAAKIIRQGGLVAFPTETVYGLGASAADADAVKKIFTAKGRPPDNPLIVHISKKNQLADVARSIPDVAGELIDKFWPGPLSLVLQRSENIPPVVSAGLSTVAVRMPDHQVALDLISFSGGPIAAPSANRSGRPSPTSYRHVLEDLSGRIDAVIRSSVCVIGVESTVLDLTGSQPCILRPGGLSREDLEAALGCPVSLAGPGGGLDLPASPGMKYRHYSPSAPLILVVGPVGRRKQLVNFLVYRYQRKGFTVGLLNLSSQGSLKWEVDPEQFAAHLYRLLRRLDEEGAGVILAEEIETEGLGLAVMNRLRKAASRVIRV